MACVRTDDLGNGRSACVAKVGSVELKIVGSSSSAQKSYRLGLYVHGDGAGAHKSGSALKSMLPWLDAHDGLGVSVLAPNGCSWWQTPTYDCTSTTANGPDLAAANAAALFAAVDALTKAYDIQLDRIYYYGSSGGSIFLTDEWIPLQAQTFPGVFALMCGGSKPGRAFTWDVHAPAVRATNPLFFTYGDQDFLASDIEKATSDFSANGFAVTKKVIPGAAHCAFDAHGEAMAIWQADSLR